MNEFDNEIDEDSTQTEKEPEMETSSNILSEKSKKIYDKNYDKFMAWKTNKKIKSFSENVLLAYFQELSKKWKSSTLWTEYSMLKSTLMINQQTNIAKYSKLYAFLKRQSDGSKVKKSKVFLANEVKTFLDTAPDQQYLLLKVALVFGIMGACRRQELQRIQFIDVKDLNSTLLVYVSSPKTKVDRTFSISGKFYEICKNYMNLRPKPCKSPKFFLRYCNGQCIEQNVGINTFGNMGKTIAKYLKLPNPGLYTGHCFRRTSATILVNAGGEITALKRHGPPWFQKSNPADPVAFVKVSQRNKMALQEVKDYTERVKTYIIENQIPPEPPQQAGPELEVLVKTEEITFDILPELHDSHTYPKRPRTDLIQNQTLLEIPQSIASSEPIVKTEVITIDDNSDSEHAHSTPDVCDGLANLPEPAWGVKSDHTAASCATVPSHTNNATQKNTLEEILACLVRQERHAERAARAQEAQAIALHKIVLLLEETGRRQ